MKLHFRHRHTRKKILLNRTRFTWLVTLGSSEVNRSENALDCLLLLVSAQVCLEYNGDGERIYMGHVLDGYICAGANRSIDRFATSTVDRPGVVSSSRGLMMTFATHWNSQYNEDFPFSCKAQSVVPWRNERPKCLSLLGWCSSWIIRTHVKWVYPTQVFFVLDSSAGALKAKLFSLPSTLTRRGDFACSSRLPSLQSKMILPSYFFIRHVLVQK